MDVWAILGIKQTDNIREIKRAYALKSRIYHPETHPEEFRILRQAYETVLSYGKSSKNTTQPGESLADVQCLTSPWKGGGSGEDGKHSEEYGENNEQNIRYDNLLYEIEENSRWHQEDLSEAPVKEFRELLDDKTRVFYPEQWKKYISGKKFLDYQYNQKFIEEITGILDWKLIKSYTWKNGNIPQYAFIYLIIAYGCMFERISEEDYVTENTYKSELLAGLKQVLLATENFYSKYLLIEIREDLLGERYAFYIYRRILAELSEDEPDAQKIKSLLIDGFCKENESHLLELMYIEEDGEYCPERRKYHRMKDRIPRDPVFFQLMEYLLNRKNIPSLFVDILKEVCRMNLDTGDCLEKDILELLLEDM